MPPTNEPTVTQQPSTSFAPTPAPTTFSQLNRLPNKPIRATNGGVDGTPIIDHTKGSGMDLSIHQLVIISVSFCAFVAFGIAIFINTKRAKSKRMKEYRQQRRNMRRKRLLAKKKEVRRKIATFKKNRRGVFASNGNYSMQNRRSRKNNAYDNYDSSRRRKNQSQNHLKCRGLALPTRSRDQYYQEPSSKRLSHRQDSFDSSVSSNERHVHTRGRRKARTSNSKRKKKETNIYKGAEFLKPVSRGGKEDYIMKVDSAIYEKMSRDYHAESQSVSSSGQNVHTAAERSHRATDLTLSEDDRTNVITSRNERGMLGELAGDVADAVDDLTRVIM